MKTIIKVKKISLKELNKLIDAGYIVIIGG
jgi:hypothetical protein